MDNAVVPKDAVENIAFGLPDAVATDDRVLSREMVDFPADYLHWKLTLAESTRIYQVAKLNLAEVEGRLFVNYRVKFGSTKEPSVTLIRSAIESDASYLKEKRIEIELEAERNKAQAMVDTLEHKIAVLTTLGTIS